MKNFITMMLVIVLTACATTRQVHVPTGGYAIDVNKGDRVTIVMSDGQKYSFQVTYVDEYGLGGNEGSFAYSEMQSVNVSRKTKSRKTLWLILLSVALVAVFAEADDSGSGPLCLYSSTDPNRRCL